ncbi:MAG: PepSY domain-containing protein [Shewanella sp.]|nr:PepSY domain-containing protein [Shewanella sp.]MCF1429300.1 PepSY domain-containing protein [Shewanella sp.]MCF1439027.1 PepSY domain-containing protein [Shewanella sp.]MCF1456552.1 PepSY domain-containing protein [Shewanella sp.]
MKTIKHTKIAVLACSLGVASVGSGFAADAPSHMNADAISFKQAIAIAKQQTGGQPMEAEREMSKGKAVYDIELVATQGKESKVRIDANTGKIIRMRETIEHDRDDIQEQVDWLAGIASGKYVTLDDALSQAQRIQKGQVYEIELDDDYGMHYKVKFILADGSKAKVKISAEN